MSLGAGPGRNRTLSVTGLVDSGQTDGGGNPIYTETIKGSVIGRIDPKTVPDEVNGPDLNPILSDYLAITALPSDFTITERDYITDEDAVVYEVVGLGTLYGARAAHHLEINLRRVAA